MSQALKGALAIKIGQSIESTKVIAFSGCL